MSETEYILPLTAIDYVDRLSKQLVLPYALGEKAKELIQNDNVGGTSPTITAACAAVHAAKSVGFKIMNGKIASALCVSPAGIKMALRKETQKQASIE